jgi:hypothetical protein
VSVGNYKKKYKKLSTCAVIFQYRRIMQLLFISIEESIGKYFHRLKKNLNSQKNLAKENEILLYCP